MFVAESRVFILLSGQLQSGATTAQTAHAFQIDGRACPLQSTTQTSIFTLVTRTATKIKTPLPRKVAHFLAIGKQELVVQVNIIRESAL